MSRVIHITHFIDPHCFYFKFDDDLHNDQLQSLEDDISTYARNKLKNERTQFSHGDIVAAFQIYWGKWVRAKVLKNEKNLRCHLWAVDHGQVFQTSRTNIVSLPQNLIDKTIKAVNRGCIHGICPASLAFNLDTLKPELQSCEKWSQKAIDECNNFINDKNVVEFKYDIKAERNNYYFGDLSVTSITTEAETSKMYSVDFKNALVSIEEAISVNFQIEMSRIIMKYDNMYGSKNISENGNHSEPVSVRRRLQAISESSRTPVPSTVHSKAPSTVCSEVLSTVVPTEIDDGITRMRLSRELAPNPTPSISSGLCANSTVIPSEIDGGATRMQMNRRLNLINQQRNRDAHMPAGFERDTSNFHKYN